MSEGQDATQSSDLFNNLTTSEFVRLGYTYAIFIFVCIILIKFQPDLNYPHIN